MVVPANAHFDGSGIIHTVATNFGRTEWENPAESGKLVVTRSSDGLYSEPPSALVGQHGAYVVAARRLRCVAVVVVVVIVLV